MSASPISVGTTVRQNPLPTGARADRYVDIPQPLRELPNWVVWKQEVRNGKKKTKVPHDAKNDGFAKSNDPNTWSTFDQAVAASEGVLRGYDGIGIMLQGSDLTGIDFDGVVDDDGVPEPYVLNIISQIGRPYCEITPSGTGLRVFVKGTALPPGNRKFNAKKKGIEKYGAEIYSGAEGGRYLTLTGEHYSGSDVPEITNIDLVYFLISKFPDERFRKLWMGDSSDYENDDSRLDLALLGTLLRAFDGDADKAIRFFNASVPGHREKWVERADYRERTLDKALSSTETSAKKNAALGTLELVPLSQVKATIQRWLWENRIPMDALCNISGVADQGKSLVLYDILARISTGADFPDGAKNPFERPMKVLLFFAEGSLETTVKPRLMVMHANMENVLAVKSVLNQMDNADARQFYLDIDLAVLRKTLKENPDIAVVAFDPITSYVCDEHNVNSPQDVRAVLTPLGALAEECHVTVISIVHFSKNTLAEAIHRTGGASTWVDFPRAAWCCSTDRTGDDKSTFIFSRIKSNLGRRVGGLTYQIEETFVDIDNVRSSEPKLVWGTMVDRGADEVLNVERTRDKSDIDAAKEWLMANFPDDDARLSKAVKADALGDGISEDGFDRARERLRMQAKRLGEHWYVRRNQPRENPWRQHAEQAALPTEDSDEPEATY